MLINTDGVHSALLRLNVGDLTRSATECNMLNAVPPHRHVRQKAASQAATLEGTTASLYVQMIVVIWQVRAATRAASS